MAPGAATGRHVHDMDYVIVPMATSEMTIFSSDGDRSKASISLGNSCFRRAGSSMMLNETESEIVFLEIELKESV
ncbi:cupin [Bradyrhizobium icense]|uniref:Cupin n=1 Tax=Bradyrhizobium icense TaxID=1274631 RepID=A0A1B1UBK2_9BRAD|nr:cupin [Bradyrhizobium icense]